MFSLKPRTVTVSLVFTLLLWSCQASGQRIRRRASTSTKSTDKLRQPKNGESSLEHDGTHRELSSNSTFCAAINVDGFTPCASYCQEATGSSLNTFIEMERGSGEKQYCCACFSGEAYCSDGIPECQDYVNLDVGGLSIKWNQSQQDDEDKKSTDVAAEADASENVSCMDLNVTDTLSCIDFCEELTGDTAHEFGSNDKVEKYYCVCSSTLLGEGTAEYCSDGMPDTWKEALSNSTVLPVRSRLGMLP